MDNYFSMDSFNRDYASAYCANSMDNIKIKGVEINPQTAQITTTKYLTIDGLQYYHDLSQEQIKKLEDRIAALEEKFSVSTSAFVGLRKACNFKRLKRADLNLVFR